MAATFLALVVAIFLVMSGAGYVNGQGGTGPCGGNYSPCTASLTTVSCNNVPMAQVKEVFSEAPACDTLLSVSLTLAASDETTGIPSDVFAGKRVATLSIRGPSSTFTLRIASDAFPVTKTTVTRVTIQNCDVRLLNLACINNSPTLSYLALTSVEGLSGALSSMRSLCKLESLNFYNSKGINDMTNWPPLCQGLNDIDTGASGLTDAGVRGYLNWLLAYSRDTLTTLYIDSNQLTTFPTSLSSFSVLNALDVSYNQITTLRTGAMVFKAPVLRFYLNGNQLSRMENGCMLGDFSRARVMFQTNKMTELPVGALYHILAQQAETGVGSMFASGNPIDCDSNPCAHGWLLNFNRNLMRTLDNVRCTSNTLVKEIPQSAVANCPFQCPWTYNDADLYPMTFDDCYGNFYQCSNGFPIMKRCPVGLSFNPAVSVCDWDNNCRRHLGLDLTN